MSRVGGIPFAFALMAWFLFQAISGVSAFNPPLRGRQPQITAAPTATAAVKATESFTAVSECHLHGTDA